MSEMELHQIRVTTALKDIPALTAPVLHLAIALWGLVDCFFGLRLFTITVKILMAFAFGLAAAAVSLQLKPDSAAWLVGASVAGLILGLILGWVLYRLGVALTAVFAGFVLSVPLAAAFPAEYTFFIRCGVAALAGVVVFLLMEPTIIVSTAVTSLILFRAHGGRWSFSPGSAPPLPRSRSSSRCSASWFSSGRATTAERRRRKRRTDRFPSRCRLQEVGGASACRL